MDLFRSSHLPQVLGFKFQTADPGADHRQKYIMAATLVATQRVSLDALLPHLSPTLDDMRVVSKSIATALAEQTRSYGVISLTSSDAAPSAAGGDPGAVDNYTVSNTVTATSGTITTNAAEPLVREAWVDNQWLGLLEALITLRAWRSALRLADWLRVEASVEAAMFPAISAALLRLLSDLTTDVYYPLSPAGRAGLPTNMAYPSKSPPPPSPLIPDDELISPAATVADVPQVIRPVLLLLGPHLSNDVVLVVRVCRLLRAAMADTSKSAAAVSLSAITELDGGAEAGLSPQQAAVLAVIRDCVLPVTSLVGSNIPLMSTVWDLIQELSWPRRFALYTHWRCGLAAV